MSPKCLGETKRNLFGLSQNALQLEAFTPLWALPPPPSKTKRVIAFSAACLALYQQIDAPTWICGRCCCHAHWKVEPQTKVSGKSCRQGAVQVLGQYANPEADTNQSPQDVTSSSAGCQACGQDGRNASLTGMWNGDNSDNGRSGMQVGAVMGAKVP